MVYSFAGDWREEDSKPASKDPFTSAIVQLWRIFGGNLWPLTSLRYATSFLVESFGWWCSRPVKSASLPLAIEFYRYIWGF